MSIFRRSKVKLQVVLLLVISGLIGMSAVVVNSDKYFEIAKNIEIFTSIYKELNTHYVDDLDPNKLMRTGIDAMMNSLDPYTVYYSESQVESYRISTEGKYNGLGAMSQNIDDRVTITEIYKNGPSEKAGLKVGDQIVAVNGKTTEGRSYSDVIQFIRGFPGTELSLSVKRPIEESNVNVTLTRGEVDIPNVPYYGMVDDEIGYVALSTFTRNAGKNIGNAMRELKEEKGMKSLILDLRNNGGGLLAEAINIVGLFVPKGSPVVSTKGKVRDRDQAYRTRRLPIDPDMPIVVLINKNSASASEIVSGCLQDFDRGVLMGQRSYGKGLVQNHREVGYNSRIKVTTSKYYIPSGRCIQSVQYDDKGEPINITDDKRAIFHTKNNRPVLDGGGVAPDVKLEPAAHPDVIRALQSQHMIFRYANQYVNENADVPEIDALSFDRFDDFTIFLSNQNFKFETNTEKTVSKLSGDEMNTEYSAEFEAILNKIESEKADDLDQYKDQIVSLIEIELAKRYHLQEGKTRQNLKNDSEVDAAIALLKDSAKYNALLQG